MSYNCKFDNEFLYYSRDNGHEFKLRRKLSEDEHDRMTNLRAVARAKEKIERELCTAGHHHFFLDETVEDDDELRCGCEGCTNSAYASCDGCGILICGECWDQKTHHEPACIEERRIEIEAERALARRELVHLVSASEDTTCRLTKALDLVEQQENDYAREARAFRAM